MSPLGDMRLTAARRLKKGSQGDEIQSQVSPAGGEVVQGLSLWGVKSGYVGYVI